MGKKALEPEKDKRERLQRELKNKNKSVNKKRTSYFKQNIKTKKNWSNNFDDENYDEYYD